MSLGNVSIVVVIDSLGKRVVSEGLKDERRKSHHKKTCMYFCSVMKNKVCFLFLFTTIIIIILLLYYGCEIYHDFVPTQIVKCSVFKYWTRAFLRLLANFCAQKIFYSFRHLSHRIIWNASIYPSLSFCTRIFKVFII
jgi:hypothetical protein